MSSLLKRRLASLAKDNKQFLLNQGLHGIEREALRVDRGGDLAITPHPIKLGAALTHPQITTDYSEALLEIITLPEHDISTMLTKLDSLHRFVFSGLGEEMLWSQSMPCTLPDEEEIPIAWFGTSHIGMLKHVYRRGLALRYGKAMQCIAGIHYNFSVAEDLWSRIKAEEAVPGSAMKFQSESYVALIRNFRRYSWLLMYLFGASPALSANFQCKVDFPLEKYSEDTLYLPYATSLRMSDMGYQNDAQAGLTPDYNNLDSYIKSLAKALNQSYLPYVKSGTKQNGEWIQINTNRLQIENEYYSAIRPKRTTETGERPLHALSKRGVQYIEVRCLDVDPFEPLGIDINTCYFLDAFLLFCALDESPMTESRESRENTENFSLAVREGRRPGLLLMRQGSQVSLKSWGLEILERLQEVVDMLDAQRNDGAYAKALAAQKDKLMDVDMTPSARVMAAIREENGSFSSFALRQSADHAEYFRAGSISMEESAHFNMQVQESLAMQEQAEHTQSGDFDHFVMKYQAGTLPDSPADVEEYVFLQNVE